MVRNLFNIFIFVTTSHLAFSSEGQCSPDIFNKQKKHPVHDSNDEFMKSDKERYNVSVKSYLTLKFIKAVTKNRQGHQK